MHILLLAILLHGQLQHSGFLTPWYLDAVLYVSHIISYSLSLHGCMKVLSIASYMYVASIAKIMLLNQSCQLPQSSVELCICVYACVGIEKLSFCFQEIHCLLYIGSSNRLFWTQLMSKNLLIYLSCFGKTFYQCNNCVKNYHCQNATWPFL